jgi:hypothetical protein
LVSPLVYPTRLSAVILQVFYKTLYLAKILYKLSDML